MVAFQRRRSRRFGLKDENIDRQIWILHKAMVDKMFDDIQWVEHAMTQVLERYEQGKLKHWEYLHWQSALELIDNDRDAFLDAVLGGGQRMRQLRRNTPLVGILTEEERQFALSQAHQVYLG